MASIKTTVSSVFGVVNTSATTLVNAIGGINTAVGMATSFIELHADQQAIDYATLREDQISIAASRAANARATRLQETLAMNLTGAQQAEWQQTYDRMFAVATAAAAARKR